MFLLTQSALDEIEICLQGSESLDFSLQEGSTCLHFVQDVGSCASNEFTFPHQLLVLKLDATGWSQMHEYLQYVFQPFAKSDQFLPP